METNMYGKEDGILIVDDDYSVREFLERFIARKGSLQVKTAQNGQEAMEIIRKEDIKLMLLDVRLPGMDGIEILREAKAVNSEIAVIMISGFADDEKVKEAMKEGAKDYIIKPFDLSSLDAKIIIV